MENVVNLATKTNPVTILKKLKNIAGTGTAYVTEAVNVMPAGEEFEEVANFEELKKAASTGKNVIYKTATYSGRARFYVQK